MNADGPGMMFDPPLTRWEKRIGWLWMITGGTAAVAMWLGIFGWWGILLVTIPILLFALIAPGLWLYLTAIILPLLATRRRFRPVGWGLAAVLVLALAVLPAWQSARDTEAGLAAAVADDRGDKVTLPRGGTVALLGLEEGCSPGCVEAMRDHGVAAVLVGAGQQVSPGQAINLPRMRLVPAGGKPCPPVGQNEREIPWIWPELAKELAAANLCLVTDKAPLASADLIIRYRYGVEGESGRAVVATRIEAWSRRGGQLAPVLRRTQANSGVVRMPAIYLAPVVADNGRSPANWWSEGRQRGENVSDDLSLWWQTPA